MVLKIKDARTNDSILIEVNLARTHVSSKTVVHATFNASNENSLKMIVYTIFGYIRDSFEGDNINPKDTTRLPKPNDCGAYIFNTKFGGVDINSIGGDDGTYEIYMEDLSHKDCNLEVYIDDRRVG